MGRHTLSSYTPLHWPSDLRYLTSHSHHYSVSADIRSQLRESARLLDSSPTRPSRPPVVIRQITKDGHPAKGQFGLFALKKIPPRCHIIDYLGELHCDDRPASDYDLSLLRLQDGTSVGLDASRMGNEARFINDFRSVAPKANAQFQESRNGAGELCMSVWSGSEGIKKGDEILVSYGKAFWKARLSD